MLRLSTWQFLSRGSPARHSASTPFPGDLCRVIPLEQFVQTIEERLALPHQSAVVFQRVSQSPNHRAQSGRFQSVELAILEIKVVNDLGNVAQTEVIRETKLFDHCFERAILSAMSELAPVHIEANRAVEGLIFGDKKEARLWVDKFSSRFV